VSAFEEAFGVPAGYSLRPVRAAHLRWPPGVLRLSAAMDQSFTYTVADLARDESVRLRCDCRVRTYSRAELAALVGRDARLHLVGLHRTL
jgi:hypothetical protein